MHRISPGADEKGELGPPSDPLAALVELLTTAFESRELGAFVRALPDGERLLGDLPQPPASRRQIADSLVCALHRRDMLDEDFFAALAGERKNRSRQINLVKLGYLPGPKPALHLQAGAMLQAGRYRLEELIAAGGFATMWRAHDRETAGNVAVKVLSRDVTDREYAWRRAMFIRGATRMGAISHVQLARVHVPYANEQGHDFCVLEYVEGRSLHAEVASKRAMPVEQIAPIVLQIGAGLSQLHQSGAVHGDVSPKNIILRMRDGVASPCLVDFDLVVASDDSLLTMAATGRPATNPYAAPEWKRGDEGLDARVDVFALGMTMVYALLGRKLPESLNDPEAMNPVNFIEEKLNCGPAIRAALCRACALDRAARPATMQSFCDDLSDAVRSPEALVPGQVTSVPLTAEDDYGDRDLIRRWQAGDRTAGEGFYNRYGEMVMRYFSRTVYDTDDIQSLVIDAFMVVSKDWTSPSESLSIRGYLLGVSHNCLRQYLRRKARERRSFGGAAEIDAFAELTMEDLGQVDPSSFVEGNSERKILLKAMRRIPVEHQLLLHLAFWEDLSMRQIASILGIPMGTAASRLRLAKRRLQDILLHIEHHPELVDTTRSTFTAWWSELVGRARKIAAKLEPEG